LVGIPAPADVVVRQLSDPCKKGNVKMLDLNNVINVHTEFRDRINDKIYGEWDIGPPPYGLVLVKIFGYSFNTYKTIGLLLPDFYYEQGCILFRTLWEAALNLTWVSQKPEERSRTFLQFTTIEYRKFLQFKVSDAERKKDPNALKEAAINLAEYDRHIEKVLSDYKYKDKNGRSKFRGRFSGPALEQVARELGGEWFKEYNEIYPLVCMYTHASPGAVTFPNPIVKELSTESFQQVDIERTTLLGRWTIGILVRLYKLLCTAINIDDTAYLEDLDRRVNYTGSLK
jgi:hypothetical protein